MWTLVSRVTGFGRIATVAAVLGPTYFANVYQSSLLLPSLLFSMLGGSLVTATLVPPLVRLVDADDQPAVRRIAGGFLGVMLGMLTILVSIAVAAAPVLLDLFTAAVPDPAIRAQQQRLGLPLMAMLMPQMLLYCLAWTGMAVQHAHGRFALAAAAPVAENVGVMATMAASAMIFGVGTELQAVAVPQLLLLGLGATSAVALHALLQWWGAGRLGVLLVPRAGWRHPEVRRIIRTTATSSGYTCLYSAVTLGLLVVAGRLPGGVVAVQLGQMLSYLPVALAALPLAAAQLPRLSRSFQLGAAEEFVATFRKSLSLSLFVSLPAGLFLFTLSGAIAHLVAFGEMKTGAGIAIIAASIGSLGPGLIGEAGLAIATSASYARGDAAAPLAAVAVRAGVSLLGMLLAVGAMEGTAILWTLGLSVSAANLLSAAYLYVRLARAFPDVSTPPQFNVLSNLAVATVSLAPGLLVSLLVPAGSEDTYRTLGIALAAVAATGLAYLLLQWWRGSPELKALWMEFGKPRQLRRSEGHRGSAALPPSGPEPG